MISPSCAPAVPERPGRQFRLWIPFFLIWALAWPFALLFAPVFFLACLIVGVDALRGVSACWQLFSSLHGLGVEVEDAGARILIL